MTILAIDIGGTAIKYALVNENNSISEFSEIPSEAKLGAEVLLKKVCGIIEEFSPLCDAVSVSTAGRVDSEKGKIIFANKNIPNYTGTELARLISERFSLPAFVENDVYCAATAEANYGSGKDCKSFICLTVGTGIGGAVILDGKLYKGENLCAGDFGEMITGSDKFENLASTTALVKKIKLVTGKEMSGREIFSEENFSNSIIKSTVDAWIDELINGIKTLMFIFDVPLFVLGGGIANEKYITDRIAEEIHSIDRENFKQVQIKQAFFKNKSGIIGAAHTAREKLK
jgi:glucokinase